MGIYLFTNLNTKHQEFIVASSIEQVEKLVEKHFPDLNVQAEIKKITDDTSHFLSHQKKYKEMYFNKEVK